MKSKFRTRTKKFPLLFYLISLLSLGLLVYLVATSLDTTAFAGEASSERFMALCQRMGGSQETCEKIASRGIPNTPLGNWCRGKCTSFEKKGQKVLCARVCVRVNSGSTCNQACGRFKGPVKKACDAKCPSFEDSPYATVSGTPTPTPRGSSGTSGAKFPCAQICSKDNLIAQGANEQYLKQIAKNCNKVCARANGGETCPSLCSEAGNYQDQCVATFCQE